MTIAVLGPGGVGGFVAGALARAGEDVTLVAREETAAAIARDGLRVESARLGAFTVRPRVVTELVVTPEVLIVATKSPALASALQRVAVEPGIVVPLLNGVEHVAWLRTKFRPEAIVAGSIRIGAERVAPGHVVHRSAVFRVEMASDHVDVGVLAHRLRAAEIPTAVREREADVLWSKLARLNPLALTTAASGEPIGAVLAHPRWRLLLEGAVDETAAVANAEGARIDPHAILAELGDLEPEHTSSLARDVAAGAPNELDAIGGAVLRAADRHGISASAVRELVNAVAKRVR